VPLLPASLIEPLWVEFAALIGSDERPEFALDHPWGCHRRRIPDRVVFDHLIGAFVHGSGYERIATPGRSDRTIRRRLHEWADAGHGPALLRICLTAYDQIIGLDLDELAVDGAITKAPCGGEVAGRSPVDRGKQGMKRSVATDGHGIPLHAVAARANARSERRTPQVLDSRRRGRRRRGQLYRVRCLSSPGGGGPGLRVDRCDQVGFGCTVVHLRIRDVSIVRQQWRIPRAFFAFRGKSVAARPPSGCETGVRRTWPCRSGGCDRRPRGAWAAASRSVMRCARSATSYPSGTNWSPRGRGGER
jgi:hypothetical protein